MDGGTVVLEGTPRAVFAQSDRLQELGLDVPQPTALCAALRAQGIDLPEGILTPEECAEELLKRIR